MNNKKNKEKINTILDIDFENKRIASGKQEKLNYGKAIIYARVSTEEQVKDGYGIESQINTCKQWALSHDIEVEKIFTDEGISGSKLDRVGLNNAIEFLEKQNKFGVRIHFFITTEASRISRSENLIDTLEVDDKIRKTGVKIIYTMHPTEDTEEGNFMKNFQYVMASYERSKIKQRTINGIKSKIYQGLRPWVVPTGYEAVEFFKGGKKERHLKINEKEAQAVKEALELFANGTFEYKYDIIDYLNNQGIRRNGKKLHKSFIDRFLDMKKLIFYAGYLIWPERGITEFIEGQHEPLIDLTTAKRVLLRVEKRGRNHSKSIFENKERDFIFKGYIFCPFCGNVMSASNSKNRKGIKYGYYYCFNNKCSYKKKSFNEQKLDKCFQAYISRLKIKEPLFKVFKLFLEANWADKGKMLDKLQISTKQKLREIEKEIASIEEKLLQVSNPALIKKFENRWAELEQEKAQLETQLDNKIILETHWKELYKKADFLFTDPAGLYEAGDFQIKKILVKLFAGKIYITKKEAFEKLLEIGQVKPPFVKQGDTISSTNPLGVVCGDYLFRTEPNDSLKLLFDYILEDNIPDLDPIQNNSKLFAKALYDYIKAVSEEINFIRNIKKLDS